MAKKTRQAKSPPKPQPEAPEHAVLPEHDHDEHSHDHGPHVPLDHTHPLEAHYHDHEHEPLPPLTHEHAHEHDTAPKHGHEDLRGHLVGTIRALLEVMEAGRLNTAQRHAIHTVRVIIGDAYGTDCPHENTAYEADGKLRCQDCRAEISPPDAGG